MASTTCPACAAEISGKVDVCPHCGKPITAALAPETIPIRKPGGKLQAVGTVLLATGIIATVVGAWWGPALLFPAVVVFFLGRIW
jgi:hypothetical protein